jgi:hypothetical protein
MPEEKRPDDVEKLLSEEKFLEDRKQALIEAILKEREAAIEVCDQKLAKLGYHAYCGKKRRHHNKKRSHHKETAAPAGETAGRASAHPKA